MFCTNCGHQLKPNSKFCPNCGEQLFQVVVDPAENNNQSNSSHRTLKILSTALLIFLLFVSCFTLSIARNPNQSIDGKRSTLSLGFHFSGTDTKSSVSSDGTVTFEHHDIPLSKSAILLMVLIWQMTTFRINARKVFTGA